MAPKVLIIEDERSFRRAVASFCRTRGFEVHEAGSLAEAASFVSDAASYDAVLLDVQLPDGSGLSLLPQLGADRSLVMTANPDPDHLHRSGVVHQLPKPLDLCELLAEIGRIASMRAASAVADCRAGGSLRS